VLFAHHREVIEGLQAGLSGHVSITGQTPASSRGFIVDTFQNDPHARVFIGQIQAAGTGITLTAASDVLFVESSWVPAENQQAAMRIHRIGQKNACLIRFATLAGSIDEQIQKAVARKTADITALLG
jgi:SWI/SNF-related matrix-associated actin-dependent regulator 1 of chromatin subfamily A